MVKSSVLSVAVFLAWSSVANGAVLCVNSGGTGGCFATIEAAVAAAPRVATIDVAEGRFEGFSVPFRSRLVVRSRGAGKTVIENGGTVINVFGRGTHLKISTLEVHTLSSATAIGVHGGARATFENSSFTGSGGAMDVSADAHVLIEKSRFRLNGEALRLRFGGTAELREATMVANGCGVQVGTDTRVAVKDSRFSRNRDGICGSGADRVTIERSAITKNGVTGVDLSSVGEVVIRDSNISGNGGEYFGGPGNVFVQGARSVSIVRSTLANNESQFGAGVRAYAAPLSVVASTISGNANAGIVAWMGIDGRPPLEVKNSTVAFNGWIGILCVTGECGPISGSIVASNAQDCRGTLVSKGFNVIGSTDDCTVLAGRNADQIGVDPMLGPLASNGGRTRTHALLASSPAIGAATGTACALPDQAGARRSRPCDVGALESSEIGVM